jgi:hypothetical protein
VDAVDANSRFEFDNYGFMSRRDMSANYTLSKNQKDVTVLKLAFAIYPSESEEKQGIQLDRISKYRMVAPCKHY